VEAEAAVEATVLHSIKAVVVVPVDTNMLQG
jgi:hypothetical protein